MISMPDKTEHYTDDMNDAIGPDVDARAPRVHDSGIPPTSRPFTLEKEWR